MFSISIDLSPISDLIDLNNAPRIIDRIHNPVIPLPQPIFVLPGEFSAAERPRILFQVPDTPDDFLKVLPRDLGELSGSRLLDEDLIAFHPDAAS